jgi:hypothetical protein
MVFRSAWLLMMSAGMALAAGACGAYPDRVFPKGGDASVGTAGSAGAVGAGGSAGSAGASGSSVGTGGGDASVAVGDASKDTSSPPADVKADVDRQICKSGAHPTLDCRCADGSVEDKFGPNLVGCADSPDLGSTWAMRGQACGPGCSVATAIQWVSQPGHGNSRPSFNYWLDDDLQLVAGMMSGACAVNKLAMPMNEPCAGQPMHICVPGPVGGRVTDAVGGTCDLHDCSFESLTSPNNYLGGCATNRTAGTLCFCP